MQVGKNLLSAFYIVGVALTLFAIVTAPSIIATVALVLCLVTLYALNDVGGAVSLRLGQLCGGLLVVSGVIDMLMSASYAVRGYATGFGELVITILIIWVGWQTLRHLSTRAKIAKEDLVH